MERVGCAAKIILSRPATGWVDPMYLLWDAWGLKPLVSVMFTFHRLFGIYAIIQVCSRWQKAWGDEGFS